MSFTKSLVKHESFPRFRSSRPMMSLQSLCSAIRSQLYFSQIVAWTEQLNSLTSPLPYEVIHNPRIVKDDQGTTAKLDILFRIQAYDNDACFSEKPLEHQFPDANLTDTTSVQVCLKSLPRMNSIPTVISKCESVESVPVVKYPVVGEKKLHICTEKGKHRCRDEVESPSKEENKFQNTFPIPSTEHREKQLQKYRKRILKREKIKKKNDSSSKSDDSSDNQLTAKHSTSMPPMMVTTSNNKTTQTMITNANTVGTQTDYCDIIMGYTQFYNENHCNKRQPICLHCDNEQKCYGESTPVHHEADSLEKAEILLQALERTASVNSKRQKESIYLNVHEIIKRQKCCQNSNKKVLDLILLVWSSLITKFCFNLQLESHSNGESSFITEQTNIVTENNNKIITTLPDVAVVATSNSSNFKFFPEPDCDTCLNYENESRVCVDAPSSSKLLDSELFLNNVEGRSNPKNISHQRSSSENVFHFDDASPCSSSSLSTPVQKSSSAPTFYYASSSLSPRFCRLAAIYNRRSRHLSDRSSTSEEQFSDDDTHPFIKTAGGSLSKFARVKDIGLRRLSLLGSLEESLLHYRIPFKHQVVGFKVLLGASGSFCPTQLTVPAVSSFYELDGHSVLTPYVVSSR